MSVLLTIIFLVPRPRYPMNMWYKNKLYFIFKFILLSMTLQLSHFFSLLYSPLPCTAPPTSILPHLSSCPWVVYISSLAPPFPILFLTSPCLFCTYHLCFLFPVPFPTFSFLPLPTDNPPRDLHFCEFVLVVCLFWFCFFFQFSY